ncbi:MAG TPA: VWD domain-containing protein [Terriglobales bacterium]
MADILEQGLTPDRAKVLFSMVVGPLPGVAVPSGSADPSDRDGTLAVSYIYQVWNSLSPEQRAAAERLIHRRATMESGRSASAEHVAVLKLAAFTADPFTPAFDFQYRSDDANQFLAVQLSNIAAIARITAVVDNDPPPGTEYAHTWMWAEDESPDPRGCVIYYHNQRFVGLSPEDAQSIITHEVVHCYQERVVGTVTEMAKLHSWITEGEACWVEFTTNPNAAYDATGMPNWWWWYVNHPETLYVKRSDDGIGVFGHLSDLAGDAVVWSRLLPVVQADIGTAGSLNVLTEGYQSEYYTTWGSSYFKVSGNKPWTMLGPGKLPDTGPPPQTITVGPEFADLLRADSDISALYQLSGSADIVTVSLMTGYGRLHDSKFSLDTALDSSGPLILCLKQGGCKCPDGSEGASLFTKQATAPVSIGINGGETTAQVGVVGDTLDHFCKKPDPKQPSPPGSGGGGGGGGGDGDNPPQRPPAPPGGASWGDTHLETFDGLGYDFQVVGEYTLARSTKDDFLVQVRQVPVLGPKIASVNQAVATRIGGQRLTFTMENSALVLRIDGKVISSPPRLKVGSLTGATTAYGGTYQLTWPDGSVLKVEQLGSYAINVKVRPAASRKGTLAGLLGDFNGSPDNDLVGQNNSKLGLTREDINQKLASAWRLNKASSLFDYQPGQSPASFFDPDFPAKDADAARLANRETAEKTCRAHGITDQRLLDDCILDLAVTNSFVFGSQYAHAQQVLAARAALARPASAPAVRLFWVDGEILDSKSEPEYHFQGNKGDVIWAGHDPNCKNAGTPAGRAFFALFDQTGKRLDLRDACDFGRLELPVTGTYTFKSLFKYQSNTVHYHVPVRIVRPDRRQQISYGQSVSGNIEQWAAHDVYTWSAKAGDLIVLSGEGCELKVLTIILDPAGHDFLGPSCRTGTYWKVPKDGTYQLVVNGGEWAHAEITGPYHFVFQGGKLAQ